MIKNWFIILCLLISCNQNIKPSIVVKDTTQEQITPKPIITKDNSCSSGMVRVSGKYCSNLKETCLEWIDKKRCKEFSKESKCVGVEKQLDFCIDIDEAHSPDNLPLINITYDAASKMCKSWNKRLCQESEWTLSCTGNDHFPYPYGFERISGKCNIDKKATIKDNKLVNRSVSIKEYPECTSPFGVHDLIGNVDEWTVSNGGTQYESILHGGFWGYVRGRCNGARTTEHYNFYAGVQTGFRCCSSINGN